MFDPETVVQRPVSGAIRAGMGIYRSTEGRRWGAREGGEGPGGSQARPPAFFSLAGRGRAPEVLSALESRLKEGRRREEEAGLRGHRPPLPLSCLPSD